MRQRTRSIESRRLIPADAALLVQAEMILDGGLHDDDAARALGSVEDTTADAKGGDEDLRSVAPQSWTSGWRNLTVCARKRLHSRHSAAMASMKASGDDDEDTGNDEEIARAIEAALQADDEAARKVRRALSCRPFVATNESMSELTLTVASARVVQDAEAKDAMLCERNDPWKQAEDEWSMVENRELKDGPARGKVGMRR